VSEQALQHLTAGAIAAQLGMRDLEILDLQAQLAALRATPGVREAVEAAAASNGAPPTEVARA
jgi:hypothetical protein